MIIDFHTHAFPDHLAAKAITALEAECDVKALLDGRLSSLLKSMDHNGITKAVICSIATKPAQFEPILAWSRSIAGDRIIPLPSLHPADPDPAAKLRIIRDAGFKGIKLHPYYQQFRLDDPGLFPLYTAASDLGLMIVCHTGFDIAFPRDRIADPEKTARVISRFPELTFITTHLGAWSDWDEVEKHLLGKPVYMELSFALDYLGREKARDFFLQHHPDYLLFGTDSPWTDQQRTLELFRALALGQELEAKILYQNAARLLGCA